MTATSLEPASTGAAYLPLGTHLVGSVPLSSAEAVFRTVCGVLGGRLRRVPDGETGPRADWIVWQYPVLSSRACFEVAPPSPDAYRALPRLMLRPGDDAADLQFESLGYAEAALASYATFAALKRDGVVPRGCRLQVSLPTPLAPVCAFVAAESQATVEAAYERAMADEVAHILSAIPHDQLALQWDTNFEFGLLEGHFPAWFPNVEAGVVERLLRISSAIPADVEMGYHFCHGHDEDAEQRIPGDMSRMVAVANALASGLARPVNWIHMPLARDRTDAGFVEPLTGLRLRPETELYLGALHPRDDDESARQRIAAAHAAAGEFGLATPCGWGRLPRGLLAGLLAAHAELSRPLADPDAGSGYVFRWPTNFERVPDEDWVSAPLDTFGLHYDTVENHGWYRNLDLTVEQLAGDLHEGKVLIDYSGGTGILLDRLLLRVFDRQMGVVIVDSSPKFLRVALDKFGDDERVAFRRLRYLKDERRLQYVDEVLGPMFAERPADVLASTNAIHLYDDLDETLRAWARVLRPGGVVRINSGNLRNPRARENEWIIDETVYVVHEVAAGLVRTDARYEAYGSVLEDRERLQRYLDWRDRVFLAPRPLDYYVDALRGAGFTVNEVTERTIEASVEDWFEFLSAYADAVLGWVGGSAKVDGTSASEEAAADRLELLRRALDVIFGGRPSFRCCWTYISARRG